MTDLLKNIFNKLKPLLEEYLKEKANLAKGLTKRGIMPKEICNDCKYRRIVGIEHLAPELTAAIPEFLQWIHENEIVRVSCDGERVRMTSRKSPIGKRRGRKYTDLDGNQVYEHIFSLKSLQDTKYAGLFEYRFPRLKFCRHVTEEDSMQSATPVLIMALRPDQELVMHPIIRSTSLGDLVGDDASRAHKELIFLCEDCIRRMDHIGCTDAIRMDGFGYRSSHCQYESIIFQKLLGRYKIDFQAAADSAHFHSEMRFYLPDLDVLVINQFYRIADENITQLEPQTILAFGTPRNIVDGLAYHAHLIIVDEEKSQFYLFDKDKPVERSIEQIVEQVVANLLDYAEEIRGKEHDRLLGGFEKVGQDLGFIPQREVGVKGTKIDMVWYDREGNATVAIEVETGGNWKKDLISTWETEPELAIILAHYKTDQVVRNILEFVLLKVIPHHLLFINNTKKTAFLFEKNSILKQYDLAEKQEVSTSDVVEI